MSTSTRVRPVRFATRHQNLQVTIETGEYIRDHGKIVGENLGRRVQFVNGQYTARTQEEIDHLRRRMNAPDGPPIWELPMDVPASTDVLVRLVTANAEETRRILDEERSSWERPDVIEACEAKLAQFGTRGPKPKE